MHALQVRRGTYEPPLGANRCNPAQAEGSKAQYLLDPPEHRLRDGFAPSVVCATLGRAQPLRHATGGRQIASDRTLLILTSQGYAGSCASVLKTLKARFRGVVGVGEDQLGARASVALDLIDHRQQDRVL